jgi:molybdopterin converting factor small subunit
VITVTVKIAGLPACNHPASDEFDRFERVMVLPEDVTVLELAEKIRSQEAGLDLESLMIVVNNELISGDRRLAEGDVVAFFAPIAGG